jgi:hypothetical protein
MPVWLHDFKRFHASVNSFRAINGYSLESRLCALIDEESEKKAIHVSTHVENRKHDQESKF